MADFPTEILAHIVTLSCPDPPNPQEINPEINQMKDWSHILTSRRLVSRRWNAIVLSIPRLWTSIHVLPQVPESPPASVLSQWLERSSPVLLEPMFTLCLPPEATPHTKHHAEVHRVTSASIPRWKATHIWIRIAVNNGPRSMEDFLVNLLFENATSLHHLSFWNTFLCPPDRVSRVFEKIRSIPSLRSLYLSDTVLNSGIRTMASQSVLQLQGLRRVQFHSRARTWIEIWEACRVCTTASWISLEWNRDISFTTVPPISILPKLRVLDLNLIFSHGPNVLIPFLSFINAPNLLVLSIRMLPGSYRLFPLSEAIAQLVSRSGCHESLTMLRVADAEPCLAEKLLQMAEMQNIPIVEIRLKSSSQLPEKQRLLDSLSVNGKAAGLAEDNVIGWRNQARLPVELDQYLGEQPLARGLPIKT